MGVMVVYRSLIPYFLFAREVVMREKKTFAKRTKIRTTDEVNKKYFLVYEGSDTEDLYFEGIQEQRQKVGIDPLIELVPIVRSYSEEGWSNPKKILDRMLQYLQESETGAVSYETLMNWIMDYLYEEEILKTSKVESKNMWETLKWICQEKLQVSESDIVENLNETCKQFAVYFKEASTIDALVDNVPRIIENRAITYDENVDKICFIFDRDRDSFVAHSGKNQYEDVLNICRKRKFGFYLTNPCFEFWLLLHCDDISDLDEDMLLDNPKVRAKRRYTEQKLREKMPKYRKSVYDTNWFIERINIAIKNEKNYCKNEEELEHSVGSRVGILIQELRGEMV